MSSLVAQTQTPAIGGRTQDKLPHLSRETGVRLPPPPSQRHPPKLPAAVDSLHGAVSTDSLIEALGQAEADEASLDSLLKTVRGEVLCTLEELQTITTHDDNLERQYKEVSSDNTKLHAALEKARREIRHLKGQLSILQMTSPEIREERARTQLRRKRRTEQEKKVQLQRMRSQYADGTLPVLTAAERARTVNARGEYVDHHVPKGSKRTRHLRRATYPPPRPSSPPLSSAIGPQSSPKSDPLPPPLSGCSCSVCNAKQSLGALTLGKALKQQQTTNQHTRSGQQILLGDRVIVKGERPGTVRYIGKLDFDILDLVYIGVHLDTPVGTCDGSLKGRQYFQCPPNHGVFVRPSDVMCVTGRKPHTGGTAVPRIRERLPTGLEINRTTSQASKTLARDNNQHSFPTSPPPSSLHTTPPIAHARAAVEAELAMLRKRDPDELADDSVVQMSERIKALAKKSRQPQMKSSPTSPPMILPMPHPPPRPLNPEPISPETPPPPPEVTRPPTPLETTLLQLLSNKDLGSTGFVTATELAAALMQLEPDKALTPSEIGQLFSSLGLDATEAGGIPYNQMLPTIVYTANSIRMERPN